MASLGGLGYDDPLLLIRDPSCHISPLPPHALSFTRETDPLLGPEHSHPTIHSETLGGAATISGSKLLSGLQWSPVAIGNVSKGVYKAAVTGVDQMDALRVDGLRATRARYPNAGRHPMLLTHAFPRNHRV